MRKKVETAHKFAVTRNKVVILMKKLRAGGKQISTLTYDITYKHNELWDTIKMKY